MYIKILSRGFCSKVKIAASRPFGTPPYFAGNLRSTGISQLRAGKTRSKKSSTPPFHIHNLKPECARIPRVLAPKKIPVENFRVWSDLRKISVFFHEFPLPLAKKICRPAGDSILMPPTFPIASLNRFTPKFSGEA